MKEEIIEIGGRNCHFVTGETKPQCIVVKPIGRFEYINFLMESEMVAQYTTKPYAIVAFDVEDADMVKGGVEQTFAYVTETLLPAIEARYGDLPLVIGGYSLGGLFALWTASKCDKFMAVAAGSPSLWMEGWEEWAIANPPKAKYIYMSIGDKEGKTRKKPFCFVDDRIRSQHERNVALVGKKNCTLVWHQGGHFADTEQRKAQAFAWCVEAIASSSF